MKKTKEFFVKAKSYILARRFLTSSIIIVLLLLPIGVILTKKFINNKSHKIEKVEQVESNIKDDSKKPATGTINTDVMSNNISRHTLSDGFSDLSEEDSVNSGINNNSIPSNNIQTNIDKSSISGINIEILEGTEFNPRKNLKLEAKDNDGSNISDNIIIEKNNVNTTVPGIYTVKARVRLSNGQSKEKEFTVTVKKTRLDVSLEAFRPVKTNVKQDEKIGFELELNVSKKHVTPVAVMVNGKEYSLYKGNENIIETLINRKNYKLFIDEKNVSGVYEYNLEYVKMSNGSWISLGENITNIEVLKNEATVKNFSYEEKSIEKKIGIKFNLQDLENTASNLQLELYKDGKLLKNIKLSKQPNYSINLDINSKGVYDLRVLSDINLTQNITKDNTIFNKQIFTTSIKVSNIDQTSLIGNNVEIIQGEKFNPIKDLSLVATDFDGEDITNKIVVENNNIDTNIVGKYDISVYIVNKNGQKHSKQFSLAIKPIAKVIEFNSPKEDILLNENIYLEIKLQMEKDSVEADKAVINGKEVTLIPNKLKNAISNIKTYSVNLIGEQVEGNKTYSLSKIIMKDGKEITSKIDTSINILKSDITTISNAEYNLFRMKLNDKKESKSMLSNNAIGGSSTDTLRQNVVINGSVKKSDGSAPEGRIEVELPTAMAFSVDQDGNFSSGYYTITNKSSIGISISVATFVDSNPSGGITINPKETKLDGLDRANLHLELLGNQNNIDLGKPITSPITLLDLNPMGTDTIKLKGEAGKGNSQTIDEKGISERFSLVFNIKKKN